MSNCCHGSSQTRPCTLTRPAATSDSHSRRVPKPWKKSTCEICISVAPPRFARPATHETLGRRQAACGPLLKFAVCCAGSRRRGKGAPGQAAALRLGGRRCAPTPLRCSVSWPRRRTHCVRCAHFVQTTATSQTTMRAARAATRPALLGASEARLRLPGRAFAEPAVAFARRAPLVVFAAGAARWGRFLGRREAQRRGRRA